MSVYRRKVQLVGGSTLVVSLPKAWSKEVKLAPGDEVVVEVLPDKTLRLYPSSRQLRSVKDYEINVSEGQDVNILVRRIMAGYVAGYNTIKIVGVARVKRDIIEKVLSIIRSKTIGLEVIDEDMDSIVLQCIVDVGFARVKDVVKRLAKMALSMHEDVVNCFLDPQKCSLIISRLLERDDIVDKLYLLLLRQLVEVVSNPEESSKQNVSPREALFLMLIAKNVERIADYAASIAKIISNSYVARDVAEEIKKLYMDSVTLLRETSRILIEGKGDPLGLLARADKLKFKVSRLRNQQEKSPATRLLIETVSRIIGHTMDVLEAIIDMDAVKNAF